MFEGFCGNEISWKFGQIRIFTEMREEKAVAFQTLAYRGCGSRSMEIDKKF
jgi:hypothetical protein